MVKAEIAPSVACAGGRSASSTVLPVRQLAPEVAAAVHRLRNKHRPKGNPCVTSMANASVINAEISVNSASNVGTNVNSASKVGTNVNSAIMRRAVVASQRRRTIKMMTVSPQRSRSAPQSQRKASSNSRSRGMASCA